VNLLNHSVFDDRMIRVDWDAGLHLGEGRQFGRGQTGDQWRDDFRDDFDAARGGQGRALLRRLDAEGGDVKQVFIGLRGESKEKGSSSSCLFFLGASAAEGEGKGKGGKGGKGGQRNSWSGGGSGGKGKGKGGGHDWRYQQQQPLDDRKRPHSEGGAGAGHQQPGDEYHGGDWNKRGRY
jgi:hypothetical protein